MKRIVAFTLTALLAAASNAAPAFAQAQDQEQQIGAQVYAELAKKGEIIPRPNAMYAVLDPIATRIKGVADSQYDYPFKFILVHEKQPNAFAVPGGNVYVTDSLVNFVQNKEELAGVLCHETAHDIHHDVLNNMQKAQTTGTIIGIVGALTGLDKSGLGQFGENIAYQLQTTKFSRAVEHDADAKGAVTCAQGGYNPWGMVWLFQNFEKAGAGGSMEALSDHPTDDHRIEDLQREFAASPNLFGRFSSDIATGIPVHSSASGYHAPRSHPTYASAHQPAKHHAAYHAAYCCTPK